MASDPYYIKNKERVLAGQKARYESNRAEILLRRLLRRQERGGHYFTGKPCKWGHLSERGSNGSCLECNRLRSRVKVRKVITRLSPEERLARQRVANRASYHKHKVNRLAKFAAKYAANPEFFKAKNIQSYHKDIDKSRAAIGVRTARRRSKKRQAGGDHSVADRKRVWGLQKGKCAYARFEFPWCPRKLNANNAEWDHRVPIFMGGSNDARNGQWLCESCNCRKGHKDEFVFLAKRGIRDLFVRGEEQEE